MSDFKIGCAALSKAGRDKGRMFAVIALEGRFALIADGDLRKLDKPKRKKLMHMQCTDTVFTPAELQSDAQLRKAIARAFPHRVALGGN